MQQQQSKPPRPPRDDLSELFARTNDHGRMLAVLDRDMTEVKDSLKGVAHAIEMLTASMQRMAGEMTTNRYPGVAQVVDTITRLGVLIAMTVAGITYITSGYTAANLNPSIAALDRRASIVEYRLDHIDAKRPDRLVMKE